MDRNHQGRQKENPKGKEKLGENSRDTVTIVEFGGTPRNSAGNQEVEKEESPAGKQEERQEENQEARRQATDFRDTAGSAMHGAT